MYQFISISLHNTEALAAAGTTNPPGLFDNSSASPGTLVSDPCCCKPHSKIQVIRPVTALSYVGRNAHVKDFGDSGAVITIFEVLSRIFVLADFLATTGIAICLAGIWVVSNMIEALEGPQIVA